MTKHDVILNTIKKYLSEQNTAGSNELANLDNDRFARLFFYNYRKSGNDSKGLRLSHHGKEILCNMFEHWDLPIEEDYTFNLKDLLILDRECKMPYYFDMKNRRLVLFEKELAFLLRLNGGLINNIYFPK